MNLAGVQRLVLPARLEYCCLLDDPHPRQDSPPAVQAMVYVSEVSLGSGSPSLFETLSLNSKSIQVQLKTQLSSQV